MPSFDFVKEIQPSDSFRVQSVKGQFDLSLDKVKERFTGNIEIENANWNIGVIVGPSGSGKSSIMNQVFGAPYEHEYTEKSVIDDMPEDCSVAEITKAFNSVGFSTVWSWLKPYNVLSNGEKMRVDLARSILQEDEITIFDEFTSVVDRVVAKTASIAISKYIKKAGKKFVAVSCHYDILDWIEPDWVYDTQQQRFFFVKTKENQLSLKYGNVVQKNGVFLKSITI